MAVQAQQGDVIVNPNTKVYTRGLGSQLLELDLGVGLPLWSGPDETGAMTPGANLSLGATGSFKWSSFLDPSFALGLDISGFLSTGPNGNSFYDIPIGLRTSYFMRLSENFQMPVHLTTALNIMAYRDLTYVGLALKPGFSIIWDATKDWSFGLNVTWWWLPEWYTDPTGTPPSTQTRSVHILELTVSALHNF